MQAVFLDSATFSPEVDLYTPKGLTEYTHFETTQQEDDVIISRCLDADIVIANKIELTASILQSLPNLKLIQLTATGMNNVDAQACEALGIRLYNVAGYAVKSVPEHTFMLMLSAMRACNHYHTSVVTDAWRNHGKFCLMDEPIYDLEGKTLGIIGAGVIGKRVAQIAQVFGMHVLFAEHKGKKPRNSEYTDFETVLASSDIISLHCPLTPDTQHLINTETIQRMKRTPLLVNMARGPVVDSEAVADALEHNYILGYASDVFESEPIHKTDPLLAFVDHPRVVYTPHNAWGSLAAQQALWDKAVVQIEQFIESAL